MYILFILSICGDILWGVEESLLIWKMRYTQICGVCEQNDYWHSNKRQERRKSKQPHFIQQFFIHQIKMFTIFVTKYLLLTNENCSKHRKKKFHSNIFSIARMHFKLSPKLNRFLCILCCHFILQYDIHFFIYLFV